MRRLALLVALFLPGPLLAQQAPASPRPLGAFAAERVAVTPVQFWRADTTGWSVTADGERERAAVDSAFAVVFRERGMGGRWAFAGDLMRNARRNPTLRSEPRALGATRWRGEPPKLGDALPPLVADNLRTVTALGDTRYALIPVELRGHDDLLHLRLVMADTRLRTVVWTADFAVPAADGAATALATRFAELVVDP